MWTETSFLPEVCLSTWRCYASHSILCQPQKSLNKNKIYLLLCYLLFNTLSKLSFADQFFTMQSFCEVIFSRHLHSQTHPYPVTTSCYKNTTGKQTGFPSHYHKDHHHHACPSTGSGEKLRREIPSQYLMLFCCWNLRDCIKTLKGTHYSRKLLWEQTRFQFSSSCAYPWRHLQAFFPWSAYCVSWREMNRASID